LPASWAQAAGIEDRFQQEVFMESIQGPVLYLLIACGVFTAAFLCLLIWRSLLESHEDDQIFLDPAGQHLAQEQRQLVAKINTLSKPILMTGVLAAILLLAAAGIWMYRGFTATY
jgi:hypothetical protein